MKLSDAHWIVPLLTAVANGETLQARSSSGCWLDFTNDDHLAFDMEPTAYRIKPKAHEYRLYRYVAARHPAHIYITERNSPRYDTVHLRHVEKMVEQGKVEWVGDWTPVPSK